MTLYPAPHQRQIYGTHGYPLRERLYRVYLDPAATVLATIQVDSGGVPGATITNAELLSNQEGVIPRFHSDTIGTLYGKVVGASGLISPLSPDPEYTHALTAKVSKSDVFLNIRDFQGVGVTDAQAAQRATDAAGPGGTVFFPPGEYVFTDTVYRDKGQFWEGSGYYIQRDATGVFGTAPWSNTAYVHGTVIRSTVTSGDAIYHMDPVTHTGGGISKMIIIGPGSGTSVGIRMGRDTPSVKALIKPEYNDVMVCNFAIGYAMWHVNEARFYGLGARGCTQGLSLVHDVNANVWTGLNVQRCGKGLVMESGGSCYSNSFLSPIMQNMTDTNWTVRGFNNVWTGAYHETPSNPTGMKLFDFQTGNRNHIQGIELHCTEPMDFFISTQSHHNTVNECDFHPLRLTLTDNGQSNKFTGDFDSTLVIGGTGTNRIVEDRRGAFTQIPSLRIGSAGQRFLTGTGSPEGVVTAPVGSWYFRTNPASAADALYVKLTGTGNTGWVAK